MAVLFSAVTMTAGNDQVNFFIGGIPRDDDDLEGWVPFEEFMDMRDSEQEVNIHVKAFLYGSGEAVKASPEEVVYITMRAKSDEDFLSQHCDNIEDFNFSILWSPDELYGIEIDL